MVQVTINMHGYADFKWMLLSRCFARSIIAKPICGFYESHIMEK